MSVENTCVLRRHRFVPSEKKENSVNARADVPVTRTEMMAMD